MRRRAMMAPLLLGSVMLAASSAGAVTIGGVDTAVILSRLGAGEVIDQADIMAVMSADLTLLSLEELADLLATLEALQAARYDVGTAVADVADQIAFIETVAEDVPIPASPNGGT